MLINKLVEFRVIYMRLKVDGAVCQIAGSGSLYARGLSEKIPGDLDLVVRECDFAVACESLERQGFHIYLDHPKSVGFDLRRQYKNAAGLKVDFFIVGSTFPTGTVIDEIAYVPVEIIWAARGYYAAKGSRKYQDQLISAGYWTESRRPQRSVCRSAFLRKVLWWIKGRIVKMF